MEFVVGLGYMLAATGPRWDPDVTPMGPRQNSITKTKQHGANTVKAFIVRNTNQNDFE